VRGIHQRIPAVSRFPAFRILWGIPKCPMAESLSAGRNALPQRDAAASLPPWDGNSRHKSTMAGAGYKENHPASVNPHSCKVQLLHLQSCGGVFQRHNRLVAPTIRLARALGAHGQGQPGLHLWLCDVRQPASVAGGQSVRNRADFPNAQPASDCTQCLGYAFRESPCTDQERGTVVPIQSSHLFRSGTSVDAP
jgi:hypothetical protein